MSDSSVTTNNKILLTIDNNVTRISRWCAWVSAGVIGIMTIILVADVIGSKFFGVGFPSSRELTEDLNVLQVFMAIAIVEIELGHIRISLLDNYLPPKTVRLLKLIGYTLGFLACGFLAWRSLVLLQGNIANGEVKPAIIAYPLWPAALSIFIGSALLSLEYILLLGKNTLAIGIKK